MSKYFKIAKALAELRKGNSVTFDGLRQADGNRMFWIEQRLYMATEECGRKKINELIYCVVSRKTGRVIRTPLMLESTEIAAQKWRVFDCDCKRYSDELDLARNAGVFLEDWLSGWFDGGLQSAIKSRESKERQ